MTCELAVYLPQTDRYHTSAPPSRTSIHTHNGPCPTNGGYVIQDQRVGTIQLLFQSDPLD